MEHSIRSEGVINLFSDVDAEFSLFDEDFLKQIANMKQKNLAIELMHKLLREEISVYSRTDVAKSEEFSKRMKRIMDRYRRDQITNAESLNILLRERQKNESYVRRVSGVEQHGGENYTKKTDEPQAQYEDERYIEELNKVIEDLISMAKDIVDADKYGEEMGLTREELSFYHALTSPKAVKDFYEDETLVEMAKELTRELQKNESIDWQYKESGRARMRSMVRRLLKKYDYPPKGMSEALDIVLKQCEHWSERRCG